MLLIGFTTNFGIIECRKWGKKSVQTIKYITHVFEKFPGFIFGKENE